MSTDDTDRKKMLKDGLCGLGETFSKSTSSTLLKMYYLALEDLSIEQIRIAITRAVKECKFFPTPAHLIELSGYATLPRRAIIAWKDAVKAVIEQGCYRNVDFADDKIINAVIREFGGWLNFIMLFSGAKEEEFLRMKFIKIYEHLSGFLDTSSPLCDYLPGMSTVDPPIIHTIHSSIPAGSLTHSERTSLPQPTNPALSLVDGLEGDAA